MGANNSTENAKADAGRSDLPSTPSGQLASASLKGEGWNVALESGDESGLKLEGGNVAELSQLILLEEGQVSAVDEDGDKEKVKPDPGALAQLYRFNSVPKLYPDVDIENVKEIGGGRYGKVLQGTLPVGKDKTVVPVAVKVFYFRLALKEKELVRLMQLQHRNVISILGLIVGNTNTMLAGQEGCPRMLLQFFPHGNLLNFLSKKENPQDYAMLGKLALDIIRGMEYLHSHNVVHGNLAARNVLIQRSTSMHKAHFNAKIGDYGISQLTLDFDPFAVNPSLVRWLPREIVCFKEAFTFKSDVWMFGVTLWEMWTKGTAIPYESYSEEEVVQGLLENGLNPLYAKAPSGCPTHIKAVMETTFHEDPRARPTFTMLTECFTQFRAHSQSKNKTLEEAKKEEISASKNQKAVDYLKFGSKLERRNKLPAAVSQAMEPKNEENEKEPEPDIKFVRETKSPVEDTQTLRTENREKSTKSEPTDKFKQQYKSPNEGRGSQNKGNTSSKHAGNHWTGKKLDNPSQKPSQGRAAKVFKSSKFQGHGPSPHHRPSSTQMRGPFGQRPQPLVPPPYPHAPLPTCSQINLGACGVSHPSSSSTVNFQFEIERREKEVQLLKAQQLREEFLRKQSEMQDIMTKMEHISVASGGPPVAAPLLTRSSVYPPQPHLYFPHQAPPPYNGMGHQARMSRGRGQNHRGGKAKSKSRANNVNQSTDQGHD